MSDCLCVLGLDTFDVLCVNITDCGLLIYYLEELQASVQHKAANKSHLYQCSFGSKEIILVMILNYDS